MDPLWIVLLGTAVMVVCLMAFRLPAFLALVLGALTVAGLTPGSSRQWQALRRTAAEVSRADPATGELWLAEGSAALTDGWARCFRRTGSVVEPLGRILVRETTVRGIRTHLVAAAEPQLADGGGFWLVPEAQWTEAGKAAERHPLDVVAEGFGATCRSLGLLIVLASIIGQCLTESGAAERIVRWIQARLGEARAPQAFALSGFLLGIPVFFDTVFYLLLPLARGMAAKTGRNFLLYVLVIVAGATMAHSLVPPTPGPLFAAGQFGVPLGTMMLGGLVVGGLPVMVGTAYARWANRRWPLALRPGNEKGAADDIPMPSPRNLPPLWLSVLPILLPLALIGGLESWQAFQPHAAATDTFPGAVLRWIGQGPMALLLAAGIAVLLLVRQRQWQWASLRDALAPAISGGGVILLITAAGGAFGGALRQTDVAHRLAWLAGGGHSLLFAAFGITALVRIAQGSATVAMITAAGVVAPVAGAMTLPYDPVYLALAVGCGSKPIPWFNDSGFWVISRMSGMTELETLRSASVMMSLMGIAGFGAVLLGAWVLPLR